MIRDKIKLIASVIAILSLGGITEGMLSAVSSAPARQTQTTQKPVQQSRSKPKPKPRPRLTWAKPPRRPQQTLRQQQQWQEQQFKKCNDAHPNNPREAGLCRVRVIWENN